MLAQAPAPAQKVNLRLLGASLHRCPFQIQIIFAPLLVGFPIFASHPALNRFWRRLAAPGSAVAPPEKPL